MITNLSQQSCTPCRTGVSDLDQKQVKQNLSQVPEWDLVEENGTQKLKRVFELKNWDEAIDLANKISTIAQEQDHHPVLLVEWGKLTVYWWTHKVGGLHSNDFIMAARTDEIV